MEPNPRNKPQDAQRANLFFSNQGRLIAPPLDNYKCIKTVTQQWPTDEVVKFGNTLSAKIPMSHFQLHRLNQILVTFILPPLPLTPNATFTNYVNLIGYQLFGEVRLRLEGNVIYTVDSRFLSIEFLQTHTEEKELSSAGYIKQTNALLSQDTSINRIVTVRLINYLHWPMQALQHNPVLEMDIRPIHKVIHTDGDDYLSFDDPIDCRFQWDFGPPIFKVHVPFNDIQTFNIFMQNKPSIEIPFHMPVKYILFAFQDVQSVENNDYLNFTNYATGAPLWNGRVEVIINASRYRFYDTYELENHTQLTHSSNGYTKGVYLIPFMETDVDDTRHSGHLDLQNDLFRLSFSGLQQDNLNVIVHMVGCNIMKVMQSRIQSRFTR